MAQTVCSFSNINVLTYAAITLNFFKIDHTNNFYEIVRSSIEKAIPKM